MLKIIGIVWIDPAKVLPALDTFAELVYCPGNSMAITILDIS
jgi:hypothetical protein